MFGLRGRGVRVCCQAPLIARRLDKGAAALPLGVRLRVRDPNLRPHLRIGHRYARVRGRFHLADYIEVGEVSFNNGLLNIALRRVVPEATKPRKIEIGGASAQSQIEDQKADREAA